LYGYESGFNRALLVSSILVAAIFTAILLAVVATSAANRLSWPLRASQRHSEL
jgi:hypothetical protein